VCPLKITFLLPLTSVAKYLKDPWAPSVYILYLDDLPLAVGLSSVMLYADDTVIFTAALNIDQLQLNLSLDLNNV